jgi:hypothetical protein
LESLLIIKNKRTCRSDQGRYPYTPIFFVYRAISSPRQNCVLQIQERTKNLVFLKAKQMCIGIDNRELHRGLLQIAVGSDIPAYVAGAVKLDAVDPVDFLGSHHLAETLVIPVLESHHLAGILVTPVLESRHLAGILVLLVLESHHLAGILVPLVLESRHLAETLALLVLESRHLAEILVFLDLESHHPEISAFRNAPYSSRSANHLPHTLACFANSFLHNLQVIEGTKNHSLDHPVAC